MSASVMSSRKSSRTIANLGEAKPQAQGFSPSWAETAPNVASLEKHVVEQDDQQQCRRHSLSYDACNRHLASASAVSPIFRRKQDVPRSP